MTEKVKFIRGNDRINLQGSRIVSRRRVPKTASRAATCAYPPIRQRGTEPAAGSA
jgi:hypothetical protein